MHQMDHHMDQRNHSGGQQAAATPDAQLEDTKLRKRIGWLNGQGGFGGAINYTKILEASGGLQFSEVFQILKNLEEKKDGVTDPTAWVCAGLRKAGGRGNVGGPPMHQMDQQMGGWVDPNVQWTGGGNSFGTAPMDTETTSKIHKRIKWLNDPARFNNSIIFEKVAEAARGLDLASALRVLKGLEEKIDQVKDPTAWAASALRKAGGGSSTAPPRVGGLAVKKTIAKAAPNVGIAMKKTIAKPAPKVGGLGVKKTIAKIRR